MTKHSAVHSTFVIERTFPVPPAKVFQAFADPKIKTKWFSGPKEWGKNHFESDFRVGGRETNRVSPPGGDVHVFDCTYQDIVPNERIVFTYVMHIGAHKISVSLTTVEIKAHTKGTHLTFTEQGVFLDGYDDAGSRERGTQALMDALGAAFAS